MTGIGEFNERERASEAGYDTPPERLKRTELLRAIQKAQLRLNRLVGSRTGVSLEQESADTCYGISEAALALAETWEEFGEWVQQRRAAGLTVLP